MLACPFQMIQTIFWLRRLLSVTLLPTDTCFECAFNNGNVSNRMYGSDFFPMQHFCLMFVCLFVLEYNYVTGNPKCLSETLPAANGHGF